MAGTTGSERRGGGGPQDDRQFVSALARGFAILQCFAPSRPELGTTQIAQLTGLPQSTVWRLCHTMVTLGFLIPVPGQEKLRLGLPILGLGYAVLANYPIGALAEPYMAEIAQRFQGAVSLGARDGLNMIYLQRCQGASIILADLRVGSRVPIAYSATGWAWLAAMPAPERDRLRAELHAADADRWARVEPRFDAALQAFRRTGYIVNRGSLHDQINGVAVPVLGADGTVRLTLSTGGINAVFTDAILNEAGVELKRLAERLSHGFAGQQ